MKATALFCSAIAIVGMTAAHAQVTTAPVGYVSITCPANSDTIVGTPMRSAVAAVGTLEVNPTNPVADAALLDLTGSPGYTTDEFAGSYYVKFTTGGDSGKWYSITANTADTITVDLNGDTTTAVAGDTLQVIKFWTLGELFNPSVSTSDPATTGNAIVASTGQLSFQRRTEVLLPDQATAGVNLAPASTFYIDAGIWKKQGSGTSDFGTQQLWPDSYFIIRHPSAVTSSTTYTSTGEVETGNFAIPLSTNTSGGQDNQVALPRPIDVTLDLLNLGGTAAFVSSTGQLSFQRRDELLVFDNAVAATNKAPTATYYHDAGIWKKQGGGATDFGSDVIPAGAGIIIRKYQTVDGATVFWDNTASY